MNPSKARGKKFSAPVLLEEERASLQSWSLIVMAYNEEGGMEKVLKDCLDFLSPLPVNKKEILIIDDGSSDKTFEKAKEFSALPFVKIHRHKSNAGIGAVLRTGYSLSRMENICAIPADGQFDLNELRAFRNVFSHTAVSFYRTRHKEYSPLRRLLTVLNRWINRIVFRFDLRDVNYVKIYKRAFLKPLFEQKKGGLISKSAYVESELMQRHIKNNGKVIQTPAKYLPRRHGASNAVQASQLYQALKDILGLLKFNIFSAFKPEQDKKMKSGGFACMIHAADGGELQTERRRE